MRFCRKILIMALAFALFGLFSVLISAAEKPDKELSADELVRKIDKLLRGQNSYMDMKMTVHNPDWSRSREFEMYAYDSRKDEKAFIRITSPARDRGTGFLKIGYNLWMYVPRTEKVMKIPPSMMHQSWMGSDFTNDDLVRESSIVDDYNHEIIEVKDHQEGGREYRLELLPKPDAPVVWGKIILWVWDREDVLVPTRQQFFDESGRMINEMIFSDMKEMGDRTIPARWEMRSMTKPGHRTVLEIREAKFNIEVSPGTFTERNLKSKDW
jgi:outer membrane lipoprotein-sorting protein